MSPTQKPTSTQEQSDDSHDDFIRNSRILIESTKNKMERVQKMSNELGYLTSLIKDDRKQATKSKQQIVNQSKQQTDNQSKQQTVNQSKQQTDNQSKQQTVNQFKKSIEDVRETRISHQKDSRPARHSVPGHIVSDRPRKKDNTPKISSKLRKLSDGGRLKLIQSTLQKVKEADAKDKYLTKESKESSSIKSHKIVIPRDSCFDGKIDDTKTDRDDLRSSDTKTGGDVLPGCLCDCGGNLIVDETAERAIAARHQAKYRTKLRGPASKHCCVSHFSSYHGPVILAGEDTAFSHLPALRVNNIQIPSPRPRSNMDIRCKDSIQMVKDSNSFNSCLNKDDIRNAEKRKLKNWWHHRCACVQEYIRQNEQMESRRPTLKPNKVTLQTTGFSSLYSESGNFVPYEEVSIGYRLMVGRQASFPISIRHLRKFRTQIKR
ncbi:uncharacterized protein LOC117342957 [Pecten maximus]|uniref:uncharacterized protein LOC117342957 n=1 Tax=Pecten maximus TaxID=6579 RepID=UPI0014581F30|nr:uncharacterized protein LOC117342957 [Pecten maximus]